MTQMMTEPDPTRSRPAQPAIPAGWYADPQGSAQRRWWNGSAWTHALEPLEPEAAAPAQPSAPWENLPGPSVHTPAQDPSAYNAAQNAAVQNTPAQNVPSQNAPTVLRALPADTTDSATAFPTRRQLREAEAEAARAAEFAASMGMGTATGQTASVPPLTAAGTTTAGIPTPGTATAGTTTSTTTTPGTPTPAAATSATTTPGVAPSAASIPASPTAAPRGREPGIFAMGPAAAAEPARGAPDSVAEGTTALPADLFGQAPLRPRAARTTVTPEAAAAMQAAGAAQPAASSSQAGPSQAGPSQAGPSQAIPSQAAAARFDAAIQADSGKTTATAPDAPRTPLDVLGAIAPSAPTAAALPLSTRTYTAQVWMIVALPVAVLAAGWGLMTLAPGQYTAGPQLGLLALMLLGSLGLALRDRRELAFAHHSRTASPLWSLLTPLAYLVARALATRRETGRGWAPALALVAVAAAIAAAAYFTPLSLAPLLGL